MESRRLGGSFWLGALFPTRRHFHHLNSTLKNCVSLPAGGVTVASTLTAFVVQSESGVTGVSTSSGVSPRRMVIMLSVPAAVPVASSANATIFHLPLASFSNLVVTASPPSPNDGATGVAPPPAPVIDTPLTVTVAPPGIVTLCAVVPVSTSPSAAV